MERDGSGRRPRRLLQGRTEFRFDRVRLVVERQVPPARAATVDPVSTRQSMVVAGASVAVVILVIVGGLAAFLRFGGPPDQMPADDEMPSASEVPVPEGLELVDARCTGGNAGCYRGIQQFDLASVGRSTDGVLHCDEFVAGMESAGWSRTEVADLSGEESYLGPGGSVAAKCEDTVVRDERTSTVTIVWPGRVEFVPFNP